VVKLDALTGQVKASLFVGSEPSKLAISRDGKVLYVGLNGGGSVRQINASTLTSVRVWQLPSDTFFGQATAEDIQVSPQDSSLVAVSLSRMQVSPRHAGVALYLNGAKKPQQTQDHTGSNVIQFGMTGDRLYGYCNETSEFGFRTISVSATGLKELSVIPTNGGYSTRFVIDKARAYFTNGMIFDYKGSRLLGTCNLPDGAVSVAPDTARNRIAYLSLAGDGIAYLRIYNLTQMTLVRAIPTIRTSASSSSIYRYGLTGIAMRNPNQVILYPIIAGL
jgi:hypothetical protein